MDLKNKQTKSNIWYLQRYTSAFEDTHMGSKWKRIKYFIQVKIKKSTVVPILKSDKIDVKPKMVIKTEKGQLYNDKGSILLKI